MNINAMELNFGYNCPSLIFTQCCILHLSYLSAEGVFEVKVEDRSRGLGSDGGLEVELVSLQYVVHVLGPPVDSGPEIKDS